VQRQRALYKQGTTRIDGLTKLSQHNYSPSRAFDLAPYPIDWQDRARFYVLAGVVLGAAADLGIDLRWGGDWDGDGTFQDQNFHDLPHFELRR